MMPAETRTLVGGGHLHHVDLASRSWATNWPLHLLVTVTGLLGLVISPSPATGGLVALLIAAYLGAHWAVVMRALPGAGPVSVAVLGALALLLFQVSDQGLHLFAAFMLVWVLLPTFRAGVVGTVLLAGGMVLVLLPDVLDAGLTGIAVALATGAGSGLFSLLMASWIWRAERLSVERQELAEELTATIRTLEETRAELLEVEHRRGAQEEAVRLAAEIHDTLAQSFTSITMLTQAARQAARPAEQGPTRLLDQIEELSRDGLAEARALISRSQQPLDLAASIDRLAADVRERTGIATVSDTSGWAPLSTRTEVVLLRTLQEALRNTERHADASSVQVRLARAGEGAVLEVTDDGRGFDPSLPTAGFGLTGMRSRLEAEGGSLEIDSADGHGTAVRAALPGTPDGTTAPTIGDPVDITDPITTTEVPHDR